MNHGFLNCVRLNMLKLGHVYSFKKDYGRFVDVYTNSIIDYRLGDCVTVVEARRVWRDVYFIKLMSQSGTATIYMLVLSVDQYFELVC